MRKALIPEIKFLPGPRLHFWCWLSTQGDMGHNNRKPLLSPGHVVGQRAVVFRLLSELLGICTGTETTVFLLRGPWLRIP
jgi:hypothetical protein